MSCCINTYNLGCFEHCKNVSFFSSTSTELIQIVYSVIDTNKVVEFEAIENEPISLDLSVLNENTNYSKTTSLNDYVFRMLHRCV